MCVDWSQPGVSSRVLNDTSSVGRSSAGSTGRPELNSPRRRLVPSFEEIAGDRSTNVSLVTSALLTKSTVFAALVVGHSWMVDSGSILFFIQGGHTAVKVLESP